MGPGTDVLRRGLRKACVMATYAHEPSGARPDRRPWAQRIVPEVWASLAISAMWLAVLFDAVSGPDIVSINGAQITRIPSAVVVALFAYLGTRVVAKYGFGRHDDDSD